MGIYKNPILGIMNEAQVTAYFYFNMGVKMHIQKNIFFYFLLLAIGFGSFVFPLIWPRAEGFYAFVASAGLAGFGVAAYIFYTKRAGKQLVCPVGSNCNAVVASKYGKFLGIPLEYMGMAYYAFIALSYTALIFYTQALPLWALALLVTASFGAFLFSLYLLVVQAFLLRQWCIWCLLSAMLSIAIFIGSLISLPAAVVVLAQITPVLVAMQFIGYTVGLGSATAAAFLFIRFLRDFDISEVEMSALKGLSELSWLGLALIFMGEVATHASSATSVGVGPVFAAKMITLFVVALSAAVLLIILTPYLTVVPFTQGAKPSVLTRVRRYTFIAGSIALSSWYFSFIMEFLEEAALGTLLAVYFVYTAIAVAVGFVTEKAVCGTEKITDDKS